MILLTGATGLLGREILKNLRVNNVEVLPVGFSRKPEGGVQCDLRDVDQVIPLFENNKITTVIHSAAHRQPDICENEVGETAKLNIDAVGILSDLAIEFKAKMLYISTDYVFDGKNAPYKPDAEPGPLNNYGLSKLYGEKVVLDSKVVGKVLRVPVLYGPIESLDEASLSSLASGINEKAELQADDESIRFPTLTTNVAEVVSQILENWDDLTERTIHYSGEESWTKFQILQELKKYLNLENLDLSIAPVGHGGANRPLNCQLDISYLKSKGINPQSPFVESYLESIKPFL